MKPKLLFLFNAMGEATVAAADMIIRLLTTAAGLLVACIAAIIACACVLAYLLFCIWLVFFLFSLL